MAVSPLAGRPVEQYAEFDTHRFGSDVNFAAEWNMLHRGSSVGATMPGTCKWCLSMSCFHLLTYRLTFHVGSGASRATDGVLICGARGSSRRLPCRERGCSSGPSGGKICLCAHYELFNPPRSQGSCALLVAVTPHIRDFVRRRYSVMASGAH